jgi:aryl-alcohol dehydrogenase-like predicted oxidoreductase
VSRTLQTTHLGTTGREVTRVGLGGEGILRTFGKTDEAVLVIEEALDLGITYFDTAPAYSGSEAYLGQIWAKRPGDRKRIFHTSKSAERTGPAAHADLKRSLATLNTDHLDLWQIHDLRTQADMERISAPGGALEEFIRAREAGEVRAIGVTGHHDPEILARAVREWPVDAVLLPVNPVESVLGGFLDKTLGAARDKGAAVIGMKVLGAGYYLAPDSGVTPELLLRFALAQPVDVVIVGCSTPDQVRTLAQALSTPPLDTEEQRMLVDAFRPVAGRLAYYRGVV